MLVISTVNFVADLQHARAYFEDQLREEEHTGGALRLTLWNQTAELLERAHELTDRCRWPQWAPNVDQFLGEVWVNERG